MLLRFRLLLPRLATSGGLSGQRRTVVAEFNPFYEVLLQLATIGTANRLLVDYSLVFEIECGASAVA